ncbi:MAG: hypothetical protein JNM66_32645 [Bryobacterales bacterium]|nr:hypothetical protein [Bryobacterales bacterium]
MRLSLLALLVLVGGVSWGQEAPRVTPGGPALRTGERFGVLSFSMRENYVYPQEVTVTEGWYRIVIDNPHRVIGNAAARLDDERGAALNEKAVEGKDFRTSFYQRLTPGKHKLRIGAKAEWVVAVTVTAQRP